jgi:hypothetical protein
LTGEEPGATAPGALENQKCRACRPAHFIRLGPEQYHVYPRTTNCRLALMGEFIYFGGGTAFFQKPSVAHVAELADALDSGSSE